jgi:drug/metabolite transporter (DMT)-like permease
MPAARERDSLAVDLALAVVVLMWASSFTVFKIAWHRFDPVAFTSARFAMMVAFSIVWIRLFRGRVRLRRSDLPLLAASGLTGYFLYQMGFVLGLDRTTALASAILISTHPIFSVLFQWAFFRRRPARMELVGIAVGFVGVAVFLRAWDAFSQASLGDLLSLGAAAAFGAYGVIGARLSERYPAWELMAYGLLIGGTLVALVGAPALLRQDWGAARPVDWLILLFAIVGPVYLAYGLWNWAIGKRGIPRTVVWGFLVPVVGGAMAVLGLHERLHPENVVGAAVVIAGLVVTRLAVRRRPAGAPAEGVLEEARQIRRS